MKDHEKTRDSAGSYAPDEHRDYRRARSDWQRQQYRVAEPKLGEHDGAAPRESGDGGS